LCSNSAGARAEQSISEGAKHKTMGPYFLIAFSSTKIMIAIKNAIIDEISAMQLLPVLINGLPHLTCGLVVLPK